MNIPKIYPILFIFIAGITCPVQAQTVNPFPPATPESQEISSKAIDNIVSELQYYKTKNAFIGAEILIIKNRRTILHESFGWSSRERRQYWENNSICNIRSMSKPLTGAAAQILIDRGQLQLSNRAAEWLPGFDHADTDEVTLEQLLTHRSGLPLTILTSFDEYDSLYRMANAVGINGLQFEPGSTFWYSDSGTDVVGAIVEAVSGQTLQDFITRELLQPLGMSDSFSYSPADPAMWERASSIYYGHIGSWTPIWRPEDKSFYPYAWGSQSVYSTPVDYAKFMAMLMDGGVNLNGKRILSKEAVQRITTPISRVKQLGSNNLMPSGFNNLNAYYGRLCVSYAEELDDALGEPVVIGHSGSDGTWAWAWPQQDLIVMYFTQSRGQATGIKMETVLDRNLIAPNWQEQIPERYRPYLGEYRHSSSGNTFGVTVLHNKLALDIPMEPLLTLKEPDAEGRWYSEDADFISVSFRKNSQGEIYQMQYKENNNILTMTRLQPTSVIDWMRY